MSSLIEGYNYDIFISYRQKDNKHDGWVTEFVNNLKGELESTFKEEISVYFDINLHDGLLETHDVCASLKEKLKCLIFIPIISRTYCDPKSFAWEHEFKAFVELASKDQFGLKVKLPNGNVASRVLPLRIHDLDLADIKECELVLGSVLRGIEFIYKEPGVNKSLKPDDDEKKNLNRTKYSYQINKVAISIKELIQGVISVQSKNISPEPYNNTNSKIDSGVIHEKRIIPFKIKLLPTLAVGILLILAGIFVLTGVFGRNPVERFRSGERITVAVLPFRNLTNDTGKDYLEQGIQEFIRNKIFCDDIAIIPTEGIIDLFERNSITTNSTAASIQSVTRDLNAGIFITGSIIGVGSEVNLAVECTDSRTNEILKTFHLSSKNTEEDILLKAALIGTQIRDYLVITILKKELSPNLNIKGLLTSSPEALKSFTEGMESFRKIEFDDAIESFQTALKRDSDFIFAMIQLATSYNNLGDVVNNRNARTWMNKAYEHRDQLTGFDRLYLECSSAPVFDMSEKLKLWRQLGEKYEYPSAYFATGSLLLRSNRYKEALKDLKKSLQIYEKMGVIPWLPNYLNLIEAYLYSGNIRKADEILNKAKKYYPDHRYLVSIEALLYLYTGDSINSQRSIELYSSVTSDSLLSYWLAELYFAARIPDKAEEYYEKALLENPHNPIILNDMAYFLIDSRRDIVRGMALLDSAQSYDPGNYMLFETKGWGMYKQGNIEEAYNILSKTTEIRQKEGMFNPFADMHFDSVKMALRKLK